MPDFGLMADALCVSALTGGAVLLLVAAFNRGPDRWQQAVGWVAGLAAGVYAGYGTLGEWPRVPALEDRDRLLAVLLPLALLATGAAAWVRSVWLVRLLRWGVAAAAAPILLYRTTYLSDLDGPGSAQWSGGAAAAILLLLAVALAAQWELMAQLERRWSRGMVAAVFVPALLAAGATVMLSGYYRGGLCALPIAGAIAGTIIAAGVLPISGERRSAATVATEVGPAADGFVVALGSVGLFAVLVMGRFFGALPSRAMIGLAAAPLFAWAAELPPVRKLPAWGRAVVAITAVVVPLAVIVVRAQLDFTAALATGSRAANLPGRESPAPP